MSQLNTLDSFDASGKRVLVRVDFNVPLKNGEVVDNTRILKALPTINKLLSQDAKVILVSHLGRPNGEGFQSEYSLSPVATELSQLLDKDVLLASDVAGPDSESLVSTMNPGDIVLLENVRFDCREKKNDPEFSKNLASLADVFVNDAFGTAHRAHSSTAGVASFLPSYAGLLMQNEIENLSAIVDNPKRPFVAIIGGSKVSDKIKVIDALLDKVDTLIIGGGMCFTFLLAENKQIGRSLKEDDWINRCKEMIHKAKTNNVKLLLPVDVVVAESISEDAKTEIVTVDNIPDNMMGLDIGPETSAIYSDAIYKAGSIFWNGPMGVFELKPFEDGTKVVAYACANASGDTIIGGGDSVAAVNKFDVSDKMTFISTGGGASMELVQGELLPGIEALKS